MRRKSNKTPPAPLPPVPGAPTLPPKPPEMAEALATFQKQLETVKGVQVVAGYGFGELGSKDRTSAWRLYVFTDDAAMELPKEFKGFPVNRRSAPNQGPAWGKAAKG